MTVEQAMGTAVIFVVLVLVTILPTSAAITWTSSQIQMGRTFRACLGEQVIFPWNFTLSAGQQLTSVEWYRTTEKGKFLLAAFVGGHFTQPIAAKSVSFLPDAGIKILHVNWTDFGTYTVKANFVSDGSLLSSEQTASLTMEDSPVLDGGRLIADVLPEPALDATNGFLHVQLTCGTFLHLGSRPVSVVWTTPSGRTLASTSFTDGKFRLNLPRPTEGGGYTCRLKDPSLAAKCMRKVSHLSRGAYVHVKEVQTRLSLLEGGLRALQSADENLDQEMDRRADVDAELQAQDKNLTSEVGRLADMMESLMDRTEKLTSDNEKLKTQTGKLTSDNEKLKTQTEKLTSDNEKLKTQTEKLTSDNEKLKTQIEKLTSDNKSLKSQTETMMSQFREEKESFVKLSGIVDGLVSGASSRSVSFYARMHQKTIGANDPLTSIKVTTNQGDAFNGSTGVFTVPVDGTYIFLVNIATSKSSPEKNNRFVHLTVDGSIVTWAASSYNSDHYTTGSCHAVLKLNVGQRVWVKNKEPETQFWDDPTTFAGVLLHPGLN